MTTFTICYSGTDCYMDQALVLRKPKELDSYNPESGYIPSKVHNLLSQGAPQPVTSVTLNGCGAPYAETRDTLPVRMWGIYWDDVELRSDDTHVECSLPPKPIHSKLDSAAGQSVEIIAIAGIAEMLGVTLHLVPVGQVQEVLDTPWGDTLTYTRSDLACPEGDPRWNTTPQSTAGSYCLRWSEKDNKIIEAFLSRVQTVILLGHSRGGVSCLIASNYIAEWFAKLSVKIVALDPVPGPGNWWEVLTHIPATANMEYVGIYAIDETSSGFNGVVPRVRGLSQSQSATTEVWDPLTPGSPAGPFVQWSESAYTLLYTRGRHATVPGSRSAWGQGKPPDANDDTVGASGNLVYALVVKYLNQWGLSLTPCTSDQINKWVNAVNTNSSHFAKMRDYNYSPESKTGLINGYLYCNARGISSTSGRSPSAWDYLEAFIKRASASDGGGGFGGSQALDSSQANAINNQRGLINEDVYDKYYSKFAGGSAKLATWSYLAEFIVSA